jgi:hypothetical protein
LNRSWIFSALVPLASVIGEVCQEGYDPLYVGTTLEILSTNIDPGDLFIQPYLFLIDRYGRYGSDGKEHSHRHVYGAQELLILETGITSWLDITLGLSSTYNWSGNQSAFLFGDTYVELGFQLLRDKKGTSIPDLRVLLDGTFPSGKYDQFSPDKVWVSGSGLGTYQVGVIIVAQKIFYVFPMHPFNFSVNLYFVDQTNTPVRGLNVYGGTEATKGAVKPGFQFIGNLGFEYSLTRNWALGLDVHYEHTNQGSFSGEGWNFMSEGHSRQSLSSSERWSLAPCLEYSVSEHFGLEGGLWFSVAGKNSEAFMGYIADFYYNF